MNATREMFPFSLRQAGVLYLLMLISVGAFSLMSDNVTPFAIALVGAVAAWLLVEVPKSAGLPKLLVNGVVILSAAILWYEIAAEYGSGNQTIVIGLGHFMIALMVCKLFEKKGGRDFTQIVVLSLLLMVASAMFSGNSVLFALILAAFLGGLTYFAILFHLSQETRRAVESAVAIPVNGQLKRFRVDLRRCVWLCVPLLAPIVLIVFIVVPRFQTTGFFTGWGTSNSLIQTGFTEIVQLKASAVIVESDQVVMHVTLTQDGENIGASYNQPYFRGWVNDAYVSGRWEHPTSVASNPRRLFSRETMSTTGVTLLDVRRSPGSRKIREEYTVFKRMRNLFSTNPPAYVASGQFDYLEYNKADMTLQCSTADGDPLHYVVESLPQMNSDEYIGEASIPAGTLWPEEEPLRRFSERTMVMPMVSPQITSLAREIAGDLLPESGPVPEDRIHPIISKFENYLRTNYPYSLVIIQVDPTLDLTTDFLLNRKSTGGNCEYFASAMVMMCRSVGINARMISGYRGAEFNSLGGYYVVRDKHAHQWAEVFIPGEGWVLSDPTPAGPGTAETPSFLSRWFSELGQIIDSFWNSVVATFDNDSRHAVFAWLFSVMTVAWEGVTEFFSTLGLSVSKSIDPWLRVALLGPILGLTLVLIWTFVRWVRSRQKRRQSDLPWRLRRAGRLTGEWSFLDELFKVIGRGRPPRLAHQTPGDYVREYAARLGPAATDAKQLVQIAYGLRFGTMKANTELKSQIASALERVKAHTRRGPAEAH